MAIETCANCGRMIGNLEKHYVWQNNIVCFQCDTQLRKEDTLKKPITKEEPVTRDEADEGTNGIGRLKFILIIIACIIIGNVIGLMPKFWNNSIIEFLPIAWWLFCYFVGQFLLVQYRLINIGLSQWLALIVIIPVLNFLLLSMCAALPEGYKDNRKLDLYGKILMPISLSVVVFLMGLVVLHRI